MRLAAEQGHPFAQGELGRRHAEGDGVERDLVAALTWLGLAALQVPGAEGAAIVQARDAVAAQMAPEEIARAEANVQARSSGGAGGP